MTVFSDFFKALWTYDPFPWQIALAEKVQAEGKWPTPLGLPTAAGKTAVIDIGVFALAMGWPCAARRIFFVVDRRVVVDEAGERAREIAGKIQASHNGPLAEIRQRLIALGGSDDCPIQTSTLRGGQLRDDAWARSPIQPVICCSTVDQVGSRLLFRGYGCSPGIRPIHAALVAFDSLVFLDEVHLSNPFSETLDLIAGSNRRNCYLTWSEEKPFRPLQTVELSATPGKPPAFVHGDEDRSHPTLVPRLNHPKTARLIAVDDKKLLQSLSEEARNLSSGDQPKVVGIIVNRVNTARSVFADLQEKCNDAEHLLLTGRIRPLDRDTIWQKWRHKIAAKEGRPAPERPIFVVATQCVEAGASIDFDALVTECASLDALRQRFGRLNRLGNHPFANAVIVASKKEIELDGDAAKKPHPVYEHALARTWRWLTETSGNTGIDFAHEKISAILPAGDAIYPLLPPKNEAPILLPAHLDCLCQTQPEPFPSPDAHYFLRGRESEVPQVSVLWRELPPDIDLEDLDDWIEVVSLCRPSALEMIQLPLYAVRDWLANNASSSDFGDVEANAATESKASEASSSFQPCLRWFGEEESKLARGPEDIRPWDTLVVPAAFGGNDAWGYYPGCKEAATDLSAQISRNLRGYPVLPLVALPDSEEKSRLIELFDEQEQDIEAICETLKSLIETCSSDGLTSCSLEWFAHNPGKTEDWRLPSNGTLFALRSNKRFAATAPEEDQSIHSNQNTYRRGKEVKLETHHQGVARKAALFAKLAGLDGLVETFERAGLTHDCGKADPRFQFILHNGDEIKAASRLLAKSGPVSPRLRKTIESASAYPKGARHEFTSTALLQASGETDDLFLHLIASHHGHGRPLAPVVSDEIPVDVNFTFGDRLVTTSSAHGLERVGSGIARRFWSLTRQYGWWGLAYLETILRLADHRQSEEEQQ